MKHILLPVVAAVIGLSCGQGDRQPAPKDKQAIKTETQTAAALIVEAKEKLAAAKAKLAQEGKYDCCIGDPCNHCALMESSCACADEVKQGEAVCNECYAGWQEGKGVVRGVKKENVKADFMVHEEKK